MRCPQTLIALGVCLLWLGTSCNPSKTVFQLGIPGTQVSLTVASVTNRAGVLDATLEGVDWQLRTFLEANEACTAIFVRGAIVQFKSDGVYGSFARDGLGCDAIGIGSLREWRNKQPRGDARRGPITSARAAYHLVYQDEEVAFLRGTFPLTSRLGFFSMGDAIAVVPKQPVCARAIASDGATLEYFQAGSNVLTLGGPNGRCGIVGLVRPPTRADAGS
jgi:hypothetical protein